MKLGKRLEAVASFVCEKGRIIDVGSNHGYLCLYFALQGREDDIIATDCNPKSLWEAEKNIRRYHQESRIKICIINGLSGIKLIPTDQIVIAGMGTKTIKKILTPEILKNCYHLILQSNNYLYELRDYMTHQGFKIHDEIAVEDGEKYYVVIDFVRGIENYSTLELKYGPLLLKKKNQHYFDALCKHVELELTKIPENNNNKIKKERELHELKKIRENF